MNGSYEVVINNTKQIEALLEKKLNAQGKGLHTKVGSVEKSLDKNVVRTIRRIATIRNKLMHEDDFKLADTRQFESDCKDVIKYLSTTKFKRSNKANSISSSPTNTRLCQSCGADSRPRFTIKQGSLLFREKKRHICTLCGADMYTTGGGASYVTTFALTLFIPSFFMSLFITKESLLPDIPQLFYLAMVALIVLTAWRYKVKPKGSPWFQTLTIWICLLCIAVWDNKVNIELIYTIPLSVLSLSMIFWIWKYRNTYSHR